MRKLKIFFGITFCTAVLFSCGSSNEEPYGMNKNEDTTGNIPGPAEEIDSHDTASMNAATHPGGGTANPAASRYPAGQSPSGSDGSSGGSSFPDTSTKK